MLALIWTKIIEKFDKDYFFFATLLIVNNKSYNFNRGEKMNSS